MVITIIRKLYQKLRGIIGFSILCVFMILININYVKYSLDSELVSIIMMVVSIAFGFLITAICNLFGRNITNKMAYKTGVLDKGKSQLQELKDDFSEIFGICILIIVISVLYFIAKDIKIIEINLIIIDYCFSAVYISLLFLMILALTNQVSILLNMLINESYLDKHSK